MASPYLYSKSRGRLFAKGHLWALGTMGSGDRQLCEAPAAQGGAVGPELVCLAQGRMIFAGSTFRRSKMRCDLFTGRSITAQSRCSSTSLPPFKAHSRPALPE